MLSKGREILRKLPLLRRYQNHRKSRSQVQLGKKKNTQDWLWGSLPMGQCGVRKCPILPAALRTSLTLPAALRASVTLPAALRASLNLPAALLACLNLPAVIHSSISGVIAAGAPLSAIFWRKKDPLSQLHFAYCPKKKPCHLSWRNWQS